MKIKLNSIKARAIIAGVVLTSLLCSGMVLANTEIKQLDIKSETSFEGTIENKESENKEIVNTPKKQKLKAEDMYKRVELAENSGLAKFTEVSDRMIAELIINGEFGVDEDKIRKQVEKEGYDYDKVNEIVEEIQPSVEEIKPRVEKIIPMTSRQSILKARENFVSPYTTNNVSFETSVSPYTTNNVSAKTNDQVSDKNEIIKAYPHKEFKSYMSWKALSPKSKQGQFSAKATPDPETAIMMYNGRYLVALGFAYADEVGQEIDIVMESGQVIPAVVGDFKATEHTCENQSTQRWDGSVVEFIVSDNEAAKKVTKGTGSYNDIFPGLVKEFKK